MTATAGAPTRRIVPVVPKVPPKKGDSAGEASAQRPLKVACDQGPRVQHGWAECIGKLKEDNLLIHPISESSETTVTDDDDLYIFRCDAIEKIAKGRADAKASSPPISFEQRTTIVETYASILGVNEMMFCDEISCIIVCSCIKDLAKRKLRSMSDEAISNWILALHRIGCSLDCIVSAYDSNTSMTQSLKAFKCFIDNLLLAFYSESGTKPYLGDYLWYSSPSSASAMKWAGSVYGTESLLKHMPLDFTPRFKTVEETPSFNYKVVAGDDYRALILVGELQRALTSDDNQREIILQHSKKHSSRTRFVELCDELLLVLDEDTEDASDHHDISSMIQAFEKCAEARSTEQVGCAVIDAFLNAHGVKRAHNAFVKRVNQTTKPLKARTLAPVACTYYHHVEDVASRDFVFEMKAPVWAFVNGLYKIFDEPEEYVVRDFRNVLKSYRAKIVERYRLNARRAVKRAARSLKHIERMCEITENALSVFRVDLGRSTTGRYIANSGEELIEGIFVLLEKLEKLSATGKGKVKPAISMNNLGEIDPCEGKNAALYLLDTAFENTQKELSMYISNRSDADLITSAASLTSHAAYECVFHDYMQSKLDIDRLQDFTGSDCRELLPDLSGLSEWPRSANTNRADSSINAGLDDTDHTATDEPKDSDASLPTHRGLSKSTQPGVSSGGSRTNGTAEAVDNDEDDEDDEDDKDDEGDEEVGENVEGDDTTGGNNDDSEEEEEEDVDDTGPPGGDDDDGESGSDDEEEEDEAPAETDDDDSEGGGDEPDDSEVEGQNGQESPAEAGSDNDDSENENDDKTAPSKKKGKSGGGSIDSSSEDSSSTSEDEDGEGAKKAASSRKPPLEDAPRNNTARKRLPGDAQDCLEILMLVITGLKTLTPRAISDVKHDLYEIYTRPESSLIATYLSSALWARLTVTEANKNSLVLDDYVGLEDGAPDPVMQAIKDRFLLYVAKMWGCLHLDDDGRPTTWPVHSITLSDIELIDPLARGAKLSQVPFLKTAPDFTPSGKGQTDKELADILNTARHDAKSTGRRDVEDLGKLDAVFCGNPVEVCRQLNDAATAFVQFGNRNWLDSTRTYAYRYNMAHTMARWMENGDLFKDTFRQVTDLNFLGKMCHNFWVFCGAVFDAKKAWEPGEESILAYRAHAIKLAISKPSVIVEEWQAAAVPIKEEAVEW